MSQGSKADVDADLRSYDQWDRYDYDGDGNFNEPDGYIDHFQIVHAGGYQADNHPQQLTGRAAHAVGLCLESGARSRLQ